ncbi:MAG: polysaccharide deacetylase family protein [Clostridia bacterium]|nr:polysaccharide deacetylase family protein [Clostridia bacterium]
MNRIRRIATGLVLLLFLPSCFGCAPSQTVFYTNADSVSLPIIMYHSVLKDDAKWGDYCVSPETIREDLLYLKREGYQTIFVADLIAYTEGKPLPQKPVMITFDDGYYNNLTYVLPILEELEMKAVISVVGSYTEAYSETYDPNPNYAHLSYADISLMAETGRIEFQNHSYDMHRQGKRKGSARMKGESAEAYKLAFCSDAERTQQLLKDNCNITPTAYTYPFGQISSEAQAYIKELGFCASLTCYEKINIVTRDPSSLFGLGRYNRPSGLSTEAFMAKLFKDG